MKSLIFWCKEKGPKKIAESLHISYGTVRWNLANLRKLYGVHSYRELLLIVKIYEYENHHIKISPRGKEVIELFIHGKTYKEIAKQLDISISGVRRQLERCMIMNNCKSILELIAKYNLQYRI